MVRNTAFGGTFIYSLCKLFLANSYAPTLVLHFGRFFMNSDFWFSKQFWSRWSRQRGTADARKKIRFCFIGCGTTILCSQARTLKTSQSKIERNRWSNFFKYFFQQKHSIWNLDRSQGRCYYHKFRWTFGGKIWRFSWKLMPWHVCRFMAQNRSNWGPTRQFFLQFFSG
jgi:hypothetical protein